LPSSSENWRSAPNECLLTSDRQPKPLPPGSAQLYGMFRSLQAMAAIFKAVAFEKLFLGNFNSEIRS
jgi:hypothetical protein